MTAFPVYGFCSLVTASLVVLLAMSTDFFVAYVNEIVAPCQHDSEWRNGVCVCDNTGGVFSGQYCEDCQCEHLGICTTVENSSSRWGCRCPSHQKWTSRLCDKCYAKERDNTNCLGDCISVDGVYAHFGPKCDTVCMPHASSTARHCIEVRAGGGQCNACNDHGACTVSGECECDGGYFTARGGEQCSMQCSDAGITCPVDQGRCRSIGGQLQCVCEPGWYGRNCDDSCLEPDGNFLPCSGHGTCGYDADERLSCSCSTHWVGDYCEQRCPGDASYPSPCSGHGRCASSGEGASCACSEGWEGADCSCSSVYTCSGHGTCAEDASCKCFDYTKGTIEVHFAGPTCSVCHEGWYGSVCHLYCDPSDAYVPHPDTIGHRIGCNGHGTCQLDDSLGDEQVTCVCDRTNPDTFCATCVHDYYPILSIQNVSVPHCSVPCEPGTCSNRGSCNPDFNGYNFLCNCDKYQLPGSGLLLDTVDPEQNCATCKINWYPSLMSSPDRCSKYCAAEGRLETNEHIVFETSSTGRDYQLLGDTEAQKICVAIGENASFFAPDADCNVCSDQGSCYADGTCKCSEGTTGEHCNIQCSGANGLKCSDHGRCIRNELDLWFNPDTKNYRCECTPYDPYTSETRQRLIKQNFKVAPPPAAHYYGQFCEFHCPRYNEEICADRGQCATGIAVDELGYRRSCRKDMDCADIEGSFCARQSSPWDSLMKDVSGQVSGKSFFSSGPDSPGYYTCATSEKCLDAIYGMEWDKFCINMLHGWYPPELNTAQCAYAENGLCRTAVENFFMFEFEDGKTWCEAATAAIVPPTNAQDACGKESFANENEFRSERVPVCWEYTLETTCSAQTECIYDQQLAHIRQVDTSCSDMEPPCTGHCQDTGNQTCETKTYCRAKTCPDVMYENSVESLCVLEPPCDDGTDWANFCADAVGTIRNVTSMTPMDTFYSCHMYRNRRNPQLVEQSIPGGVRLNGMLRVFGEDVSVESVRASLVESVIPTGSDCKQMDFTKSDFCTFHLEHLAPSWYVPIAPPPNWFLPWLVACPEGPDSLWSSEAEAIVRISSVSLKCVAFHRASGLYGDDWSTSTDEKDTISYTMQKKWTLRCPGRSDVHLDSAKYTYEENQNAVTCRTSEGWVPCSEYLESQAWSPWPTNPSGCTWVPNELMQRWGESGWSPSTVQREFTESCLDGLSAPWIPRPIPLPTLCDLGACHSEDECLLCSDPLASCDGTASVQCRAPAKFYFRDSNRCGRGGRAWQPFAVPSRTYFCDWVAPENVTVSVNNQVFDGYLTSRGILSVTGASSAMTRPSTVMVHNVRRNITSFRSSSDTVSFVWSVSSDTPAMASETYIEALEPCNVHFNWYSYCASQTLGTTLDTRGALGLGSEWSGTAELLVPGTLTVKNLRYQSTTARTTLVVESNNRLRVSCGPVSKEGVGTLTIPGPFTDCTILSVYGKSAVSSITIDGDEHILDFDQSLAEHSKRSFFAVDRSKNKTSLSDWSFHEDGSMQKNGFVYDNSGVRFDIGEQQEHVRVSGWLNIPEDDGELVTVRLTNSENDEFVQLYVWARSLYIKRGALTGHHGERIAAIPTNTWFYWHVEAKHIREERRYDQTHVRFNANETYFAQEWEITVQLDLPEPVQWRGVTSVESAALTRRHFLKSVASFHDISGLKSHECSHACFRHEACQQWSWSEHDEHCYLHSVACHNDPMCVHGSHTLQSLHSHKISLLEMHAGEPKTENVGAVRWKHLRADPVLESPVCDHVAFDQLHERWRAPFEALYVPFEPDATTVCNALSSSWSLMPDYTSKVCFGEKCNYEEHDLAACGAHLDSLFPNVTGGCDATKFLNTNWTAYCHYVTSFDVVKTDDSRRIPFLGGLAVNMDDMCETSWLVYDGAQAKCGSVESSWFNECFQRTSVYEDYCSSECISQIEDMLETTNAKIGLCERRTEFLNVSARIAPSPCECSLDGLIITEFCLMQDAYHDKKSILIPELYHSDCSDGCAATLQQSMNRSDWLEWCSDLSSGNIPGVCSETVCNCDEESNIGVAGRLCELSCPSGISDGQELACSGSNGRCFARDPSEMREDITAQRIGLETRETPTEGTIFSGPLVPVWVVGPNPSMEGRCQCALGSGVACSIPCDRCNNGTYGVGVSSQYGICDSFNGICRAFPAFMRYNTKFDDPELEISYNTTAFESGLGTYRWQFPERFLFESDETLMYQSLRYQRDSHASETSVAIPLDTGNFKLDDSIDTMLHVFNDLCWPESGLSLEYLNNEASVTFSGLELTPTAPTRVLKNTAPPSWGQCKKVVIDEHLYFCFARGKMHAFDRGPLFVKKTGVMSLPRQKMAFVKRGDSVLYAYGGEYPYEKTTRVFDALYKIRFHRRDWSPYDIIFMDWQLVQTEGSTRPSPQIWAPMFSFYNQLLLVQSVGDKHTLFSLRYKTLTKEALWSKRAQWVHNASVVNILGNRSLESVHIVFNDSASYFFQNETLELAGNLVTALPAPVSELASGWAPPSGLTAPCTIEMTNESLKIGGLVMATYPQSASSVIVYLEELRSIDALSKSQVVLRVQNAIEWRTGLPPSLDDLLSETSYNQKWNALETVSRIYKHQARWSLHRDIYVRHRLSKSMADPIVQYVPSDDEPADAFLNFFSALDVSFFEQSPATTPRKLALHWEGDNFQRVLVLYGLYDDSMTQYSQKIDFERDEITASIEWSVGSFKLHLSRSNGAGHVEWAYDKPIRTFVLVMHIEEWLYDNKDPFSPMYSADGATGASALLQLFVVTDAMESYNMMSQTNTFLQYTPSHCSLSAGEECYGLLPYTNLPCSGRGKCSISCQCTCEVAKSVLSTSSSALANVQWVDSPYRGRGCEITCPGYDGYDLSSICNSRGACQRDGKCTCSQGFTGEACQFQCPVNNEGETCSLHGGCGTMAIDMYSYALTGDSYTDTLATKNIRHYEKALGQFYDTCIHDNFMEQKGSFGPHTNIFSIEDTLRSAQTICAATNRQLNLDISQEHNRVYPSGLCTGVREMTNGSYATVMLGTIAAISSKVEKADVFECERTDCSLHLSESDDHTLMGVHSSVSQTVFTFRIQYTHGNSVGRRQYLVNGRHWTLDMDWTHEHCRIQIGTDSLQTVVNSNEATEYAVLKIQGDNLLTWVYPVILPVVVASTQNIWLAPRYTIKYLRRVVDLTGNYFNAPSEDTNQERILMTRRGAEMECDLYAECIGLIRWHSVFKKTLYSMFSTSNFIDGHTLADISTSPMGYEYFAKTSHIYRGRIRSDSNCVRAKPGLSKYPSVEYTEEYNIPIQNADLRLVEDQETGAVQVGHGIWTKCWTHKPDIRTKHECYQEAQKSNFGFAFSDKNNACLIYSGITDPSKIQLDKFSDETLLSINDPCQEDAIWIT